MGEEVVLGGGVEQALITDIAFWVVASSTIVAALAVVGAERILESSIDEAKHRELIDKLAAEL